MARPRNRGMWKSQGIPREQSAIMLANLETWRKEAREKICGTKRVLETTSKLASQNCVCVVGVAGAGKTTAMHYSAVKLEEEHGFAIYSITDLEEFFEFFDAKKKQVFVLDDALGAYSLCKHKIGLWEKYNVKISDSLGEHTKLILAVRTQLYNLQKLIGKDFIFLDSSVAVDFSDDDEFEPDVQDMKSLLSQCLYVHRVGNREAILETIWPSQTQSSKIVGSDFSHCFPILCKVFSNEEGLRNDPQNFFSHPFAAFTKVFQNMKHSDSHQFCGLVLCCMYGGKLPEDTLSSLYEPSYNEEDLMRLRKLIMNAHKLECPKDLEHIENALKSLVGVYLLNEDDEYRFSHPVYQDIITYLYGDPLFLFKFARSEFIRDRIRVNKRNSNDPHIIMYSDDRNIGRLVDRLIKDVEIYSREGKLEEGVGFIANNPNIDENKFISDLSSKLLDRQQSELGKEIIDKLFKQCMKTVYKNSDSYVNGVVTQYRLIELCVGKGVDCNMVIEDNQYPLHIAAMSGSLALTKLLLQKGADKRRVVGLGYSILHYVCLHTKYNKLKMMELLTQPRGDQSVVKVISDKQKMLEALNENQDSLYPLEVLSNNSIKYSTHDKQQMKQYISNMKENGGVQLVIHVHNDMLTYSDEWEKGNVLHYSADDLNLTRYLLSFPQMHQCVKQQNRSGKTPLWLVKHEKGFVSHNEKENMIKLYYEHISEQEYEMVE